MRSFLFARPLGQNSTRPTSSEVMMAKVGYPLTPTPWQREVCTSINRSLLPLQDSFGMHKCQQRPREIQIDLAIQTQRYRAVMEQKMPANRPIKEQTRPRDTDRPRYIDLEIWTYYGAKHTWQKGLSFSQLIAPTCMNIFFNFFLHPRTYTHTELRIHACKHTYIHTYKLVLCAGDCAYLYTQTHLHTHTETLGSRAALPQQH